jgi:apolipoprotein N-acyltransferase
MLLKLALTLLSAALYAASFPPLSLAPLAWVALAPFFAAVALVRPRQAAVLGCVWGVAAAYGVAWWLPAMVSGYFQVSRVVGWLVFLAISVTLAGWYFAAFAAWLSALARRGVAGPLTVAVGWGVCEFARSRLLVGNPWALAGYSQVSFPSLMQIADVTGPYGVGMLVAGVNAAAAGAVVSGLRGRRPLRSAFVLVFALGAALGYGQWRLGQEFGSGPRLRVALVQGAIPARFRWQPGFRAASMDRYLALSDDAAAEGPQLVVWPENAIDFYLQEPIPEAQAVLARSRALHADLIVNGPRYDFEGERTVYRNTVFVLHDGRIAARHDKLRLLPVAEGQGPGGLFARDTSYTPGRHSELLEAAGARIGSLVCFEVMYPELVRPFTDLGADLLVNVSNDVWFGAAAGARHHLDIASVRAIENRRYLLRATSTGYSAIVDPHGQILTQSPLDEPAIVSGSIELSSHPTPYQRVGDLAAWLAVLTAAGCSVRALKRRPTEEVVA